jgi:hypothetical protein
MTEAARGVDPVKDAVIEPPQYYVETQTSLVQSALTLKVAIFMETRDPFDPS